MNGAGDRWKLLERIGDHAAGELTGEDARETGRFVLEDPEGWRLAEVYARMLALLAAIGAESPNLPEAIADDAIRRADDETKRRRTTCEADGEPRDQSHGDDLGHLRPT